MKQFLLLILLGLAISSTVTAQEHGPDSWVKFTSELGRFSVLVPEKPTEQTDTTQSEHGPYTTHLFVAKSDKSVFVIGYVDYDPSFNFKPQNELDANRDNFVKGIKATLINSRNLTLNGYQSLEFTAETADATFKSRVYIVGRRPYQVIVRTDKGLDDQENTTRFFDSFIARLQ